LSVVAFAGTAKLIAASTNPGAAIRGVLVHLIRQFSQSGISWGKAIVLKIGIGGDVRNWCRERIFSERRQWSSKPNAPFNERATISSIYTFGRSGIAMSEA
jgi:hypothetical protein